jgi:hypothetical protein
VPGNAPSTRWSMLIFLLVWLLSAVYLGVNLNKGWVPHDEGTLGQSAERVLHGEIPHRDFEDPYTGGLAYIDAVIFKLFGINLLWLRLFLFACFLVWVPTVYALAREFLTPWPAAGVTLVAAAWSVPNYPAATPSWFNLFFATFGTLALAKYIRRPCSHWLIVAGLCGGISFLIKSVALCYVAGALLFFVYREQLISRNRTTPPRKTFLYLAFLTFCLLIFAFTLIKLVFAYGHAAEYLHFVFPGLAVALLLAYGERTGPKASDLSRFSELFKMAAPFLAATAIPVAFFCLFYWHHKAMNLLVDGLFVGPFRRLLVARRAPPGLIHEYPPVLAALFLIEVAKLRGQPRRFLSIFLTAFAAMVLLSSRHLGLALTVGLASVLGVVPVLVLAAVVILFARPQFSKGSSENNERLALFLTMTALLSLVQFPYSDVTYFCYFATLTVLLAACLISRFVRPPRIILTAMVAFYVFYAGIITNVHFMGDPDSDYASTPINLPRAGAIRVSKDDVVQYGELIPFIQSVAAGKAILAGPDCPEVYFLSGLKNPTPVLFDSLSQPQEYNKRMQALVDRSDFIKVAVINESPEFSYPQLKLLQELVYPRFPESRKIGRFTVYWRH